MKSPGFLDEKIIEYHQLNGAEVEADMLEVNKCIFYYK